MIKDISTVLAYQNEDLVLRFAEDYQVSYDDSSDIFMEMKRWLFICAKRQGKDVSFRLPLFNEAYIIDLMWHHFLLFTKDYQDFCDNYFGFFIHHTPRPHKERMEWKQKILENREAAEKERRVQLKKVYSYLYDELGPATLMKWCEEYPEKFSSLYK